MKKIIFISIISAVLLLCAYLITGYTFPKSLGRFPGFVLLFVADLYLFFRTKQLLSGFSNTLRRFFAIGHWIPAVAIATVTITSSLIPFQDWNIPLRTYLTGGILVIYIFKAIAAGLILVVDITALSWKFGGSVFTHSQNRQKLEKYWRIAIKVSLSIASIILLIFFSGMFNVYNYVVKEKTIQIEDLPPSFQGFTMVQISDIHLGSWSCKEKLRKAIDKINSIEPDAIMVTGDLLNYTTSEGLEFEEILSGLHAKYGIFCVAGNHDYGNYVNWSSREEKEKNFSNLSVFYSRLGWKFLLNSHSIIKINSDSIAIVGVENWSDIPRFPQRGRLDLAVKGIENVPVKILLSHDPKHWHKIVKHFPVYIDITLSGHTHAFQMGYISGNYKWSPAQWLYPQWVGWYEYIHKSTGKPSRLNVNAGLGVIGYPGRIGVRPEITVIRLEKLYEAKK